MKDVQVEFCLPFQSRNRCAMSEGGLRNETAWLTRASCLLVAHQKRRERELLKMPEESWYNRLSLKQTSRLEELFSAVFKFYVTEVIERFHFQCRIQTFLCFKRSEPVPPWKPSSGPSFSLPFSPFSLLILTGERIKKSSGGMRCLEITESQWRNFKISGPPENRS